MVGFSAILPNIKRIALTQTIYTKNPPNAATIKILYVNLEDLIYGIFIL